MNEVLFILNEETDLANSLEIVKIVYENVKNWIIEKEKNNHININGKWGTGKTTIALSVLNKLDETENYEKVKTHILNAWEYENLDNSYLKIIVDLASALGVELDEEQLINKIKKPWKLKIGASYKFNNQSEIAGEIAFEKGLKSISKINKINKFDDLISKINSNVIISGIKHIILFDDLDRCASDKMVGLLSLIKTFLLQIKNVYFIITTNNEAINSIAFNNYSNPGNAKSFEENYTDKIFYKSIDLSLILNLQKNHKVFEDNELIFYFHKNHKSNFRIKEKLANYSSSFIKNLDLINKIELTAQNERRFFHYVKPSIDEYKKISFFFIFIFYFWKNYRTNTFKEYFNFVKEQNEYFGKNTWIKHDNFIKRHNLEIIEIVSKELEKEEMFICDKNLILVRIDGTINTKYKFLPWDIWWFLTKNKKITYKTYEFFDSIETGRVLTYHMLTIKIDEINKQINKNDLKDIILEIILNSNYTNWFTVWQFVQMANIFQEVFMNN